jgi:hypothetical protein
VPADRPGTVWASTWVPAASPFIGFGAEGYAACWVDLDPPGGGRVQVLAEGEAPAPGTSGCVVVRDLGGQAVEVFVPDAIGGGR